MGIPLVLDVLGIWRAVCRVGGSGGMFHKII